LLVTDFLDRLGFSWMEIKKRHPAAFCFPAMRRLNGLFLLR